MPVTFTNGHPWQQQFDFNTTQSADVGPWGTVETLPHWIYDHISFVTNNRAYIIGGISASGITAQVLSVPINTDGTLSTPWVISTDSFPVPIIKTTCAVIKDKVYVIGGYDGAAALNTTYVATIGTDGIVGAWTAGPTLPIAILGGTSFVIENWLYVFGEYAMYKSPIASDGTIGAWVSDINIPPPYRRTNAVLTGGRLYFIGGYGADNLKDVWYAPVVDGVIGTWVQDALFPLYLKYIKVVTTEQSAYMVIGNQGVVSKAVYKAPIVDGVIGTWVAGPTLPVTRDLGSLIITSSKVYVIGGMATSASTSAAYADFTGGLNDYTGVGEIVPAPTVMEGTIITATPVIEGQAVIPIIAVGYIKPKVGSIFGSATTTNFIEGRINTKIPEISASVGAGGDINVPVPSIEGSINNPYIISGNLIIPKSKISTDGYVWPVGTGNFRTKVPVISGQIEQLNAISCHLVAALPRIIGNAVYSESINVNLSIRPPKISAAMIISDAYTVIKYQDNCA